MATATISCIPDMTRPRVVPHEKLMEETDAVDRGRAGATASAL